jgi:signal transduction histidine kinase
MTWTGPFSPFGVSSTTPAPESERPTLAQRLASMRAPLNAVWRSHASHEPRAARRPAPIGADRYGFAWRHSADKLFAFRITATGLVFDAVNLAFAESVGLADEDVSGRAPDQVLHPVVARALVARCRECMASPAPTHAEANLPFDSGRARWAMTLSRVCDADTGDILILGSARDVDGEAPTAPAATSVEAADCGRFEFTAFMDGRPDHIGLGFFALTGLPPDAGSDAALARVHPDDVHLLTPDPAKTEESFHAEVRIRGADGRYRRFILRAELFDGPAGRRWYGAATDAERTEAAKAPGADTGEHLFNVIRDLNGCCVNIDRDWRVVAITPEAATWIGLSVSEVVGLNARDDLVVPQPLASAIEAAFISRKPTRTVFPPVLHAGHWAEYQVFPFADGANILFWDVTDEQLARNPEEPPTPANDAYSNAFHNVGGCMLSIDRNWQVTSISPAAAAWSRVSEAELLGVNAREHWLLPMPLVKAIQASFDSGVASTIEFASTLRPGRWVEFHIHPFPDGAYILFADITERRTAEQAVGTATDLLHGLSEALHAEIALLDGEGKVISVNRAWRALMAGRGDDLPGGGVGVSYLELCRRGPSDVDMDALERGMDQLLRGEAESVAQVYTVGSGVDLRWRQVRLTPLKVGAATHLLAIHEDLTEFARAQAAQRHSAEQLMAAQEEERERIAIELHDSTSQHLVAIGLGVARLRRLLGGGRQTTNVLEDMTRSLQEAIKEIRVLSYLMKPTALERDGLEATARRFVRGFGVRTGVEAAFGVDGDVNVAAPEVQHAVFRVLQEALSNVYRHARARHVGVELAIRGGRLELSVADDGQGFEPAPSSDPDKVALGVGIAGMQARVAQLGGAFDIASGGQGTTVSAALPLALTGSLPAAAVARP